ncbi:MAG: hypothetical protein IJC16_00125 [Rikenellaceae bacterium]|nr:hypothetical protein [Rikenellaceae bacterium]
MEIDDLKPGVLDRLYVDLARHLMQITRHKVPVFKFIDLWNNQWQHMAEEKVLRFPCVLIEFGDLEWQQLGSKRQQAALSLSLHIGSKSTYTTAWKEGYNAAALEHLQLLGAVHRHMKGFRADYAGSFTRVGTQVDQDHDHLIAHVESYRAVVRDDSAAPVTERRKVPVEVTAEYL